MTTLRAAFERWLGTGRVKVPEDPRTPEEFRAVRQGLAWNQARMEWRSLRWRANNERYIRRLERRSGKMIMPRTSREMELVQWVTARSRSRRDDAAALLSGRDLSPEAARPLIWQLGNGKPAYREAARVALWGSTVTDPLAVRVLSGLLEHRKPEVRGIARQVLQETTISTDHDVMEDLESARRRGLADSDDSRD